LLKTISFEPSAGAGPFGELLVALACVPERRDWFKEEALATISRGAMARAMPELHPATLQTIILRAGLTLGILRPMGG